MIHYNMSYAEYAALPGWRWSTIKLLHDHSPRAVQYALNNPRPDTAGLTWLRAVHCLTLEPHRFGDEFSVYDGTRRGKLYDAHLLCNPGLSVMNPREYENARATADAIWANETAEALLNEGDAEVSVTWTDAATGLECKGRIDWLGPRGVVDLKTSGTVHERKVASMVARNLWHGQLAHYCAGLKANGYLVSVPWEFGAYIIAAEGKGAQDVAAFCLDDGIPDGALYVGAQLRERLMTQLAQCVASDEWPGRHEEAQDLCLPSYAFEETEITFGEE